MPAPFRKQPGLKNAGLRIAMISSMMKHKKAQAAVAVVSVLAAFFLLPGCYLSYDAYIQIYNYDNCGYRVELRRAENDGIVDVLELERYPRFDSMDYFEDVPEGRYYLSIFKDKGDVETDRTASFFMEDDDRRCYLIEDDGVIDRC